MRDGSRDRAGLPATWALALAMQLLPAQAAAQSVQKCIAADGHVTLTSGECGAGERLAASYEAEPEPVAARAAAVASTGQQASRTAPAARRTAAGRATRARTAPDRCKAARDRRERTLQRVGLKRTFDLLRRLDDEVWEACR